MPSLLFPLPLLLSLFYIGLPSCLSLSDPVGALLEHHAPLDGGLFAFGETDFTARFAKGSFGLFESLRTVSEGRGRHDRRCSGRKVGVLQM